MADIAMLVAEEYERRVKNSRKFGDHGEEINFFSGLSVLAKGLERSCYWIKERVGDDKIKLVNTVLEPKTQIGVEASNGLFSA